MLVFHLIKMEEEEETTATHWTFAADSFSIDKRRILFALSKGHYG